jgi:hypothetical protein
MDRPPVGSEAAPLTALSAATPWPSRPLPASAARRVDPSQFLAPSQLLAWQQQLDRMGLRATGSEVHERFVDQLRDRLERAGVRQLRFESVPIDRWTTDSWSLRTLGRCAQDRVVHPLLRSDARERRQRPARDDRSEKPSRAGVADGQNRRL